MENGGSGESETPVRLSGSIQGEEDEVRLEKLLKLKVYKRRWFVLLVLCLLNLSNAMLWLSFAPVASQTAAYLGVSLAQVNWLSLVYMLVSVPLSLGTTWMLDTLGLRVTLIVGSWLNMTGAVVRFVGMVLSEAPSRFPVVLLGQTLSALAQPLIIFTPTKLAALWFPEHQRATANMLASMYGALTYVTPPKTLIYSEEVRGAGHFKNHFCFYFLSFHPTGRNKRLPRPLRSSLSQPVVQSPGDHVLLVSFLSSLSSSRRFPELTRDRPALQPGRQRPSQPRDQDLWRTE